MKKIYILAILLSVTGFSCKKDFINLSPPTQLSELTFFETEAQFRQAVVATYVPLRGLVGNEFYVAEMRSDNTHYEFFQIDRGPQNVYRENIADFTNQSSNDYSASIYFNCFSGISKANIVIGRIADATIPDAAKREITGEAKFLRALYYYKLVRYFGGVPLYLKEVKKADDAFLARSGADAVYTQIISDVQEAINNLAAPTTFPQSGKATKGSATMLLAEVYMVQKKYAEAEALLKTLSGMGYTLLPNYADVFSTANKNSRESIFEVQYLEGLQGGQQSNFIYVFLPRSRNTKVITGVNTDNNAIGGWNTPTQDMMNTYEPNDKRKDASIAIAEGNYDASLSFTFSALKSVINYTPAPGTIGVPFVKKYLNPHANPNNTNDNWPVYRYADALLLLAEAQNEQGNTASAITNLNLVRARAGLAASTVTDQAGLRDVIAHERRVELAFENHRWLDLVRTGKAIEVMNADGVKLKQQYSYLTPDSYMVNTNKLIYPIPVSEIQLNPALIQNPGY